MFAFLHLCVFAVTPLSPLPCPLSLVPSPLSPLPSPLNFLSGKDAVQCVCVLPDAQHLVTGSDELRLWDLDHTLAPVVKFQEKGHTDMINAVKVGRTVVLQFASHCTINTCRYMNFRTSL